MSRVKVFERVAAARLTGRTLPGAVVEARISLRSLGDARVTRYRNSCTSDAKGRYTLKLPYPTGPTRAHVRALGRYRITVRPAGRDKPAAAYSVTVTEDEVRAGTVVQKDLRR